MTNESKLSRFQVYVKNWGYLAIKLTFKIWSNFRKILSRSRYIWFNQSEFLACSCKTVKLFCTTYICWRKPVFITSKNFYKNSQYDPMCMIQSIKNDSKFLKNSEILIILTKLKRSPLTNFLNHLPATGFFKLSNIVKKNFMNLVSQYDCLSAHGLTRVNMFRTLWYLCMLLKFTMVCSILKTKCATIKIH